jgi:ribosomal protein S21
MSILRYFEKKSGRDSSEDDFPSLDKVVPASTAQAVREELKRTEAVAEPRKRGAYEKLSTEKKAKIAKYASENGIAAAVRHFSREGLNLKESSVRGWKKDYHSMLARKNGEQCSTVDKVPNVEGPLKQHTGRPLLLGADVEEKSKAIIKSIRESGGTINNSVVIGIIKGVIKDSNSNLLSDNGGPIFVDKPVARRLLSRMSYVKRRGTTKAKVTPADFELLKQQFLEDIRTVVAFEQIPDGLILNWDHTGLNYVPTSSWTLEIKGAKKVPIAAIDDKRQLTAVFTCSLAGDFLPAQVIYGGKTPACLPKTAFPPTWQITYTPNHWANEQTMMDYVHGILLPFVQEKRRTLSLPPEYPALVIFDQFKGQLTDAFLKLLDLNNIVIVQVPANCTDRLQPLDLSVNKAIKDCLRSKFQWWYTQNVSEQLKKKRQMSSPLISGCQS